MLNNERERNGQMRELIERLEMENREKQGDQMEQEMERMKGKFRE